MTDPRAEIRRHSGGKVDIVVSDAVSARSAAIISLIGEVNDGNEVTIRRAENGGSSVPVSGHDNLPDAPHNVLEKNTADAPGRHHQPATGQINDTTLLSRVATRLGAGVSCGMLSLLLAPNSFILAGLSALAGVLIINVIANYDDHQ